MNNFDHNTMKLRKIIQYLIVFLLIFFTSGNYSQVKAQKTADSLYRSIDLDSQLPIDPKITIGELDNGLHYYIRENKKPEDRAELRLVVNVGSILEDENQRGLAHFVEHMAFNGTKHFKKQKLVDYLESIGMKFGPDVNAYTSFDETVYKLQVPTDSLELLEKGFQILEDWAHNIRFDEQEIDKERGVIVEEWRSGRGAKARMRDKQWPILFRESRYAERLPIGLIKIIKSFKYETLRQFYEDWYRPDLMAVIAVGDFDANRIESLVKKYFSRIPEKTGNRERRVYPVPDHDEPLFAIATDPEAVSNQITVYHKLDILPEGTVAQYRRNLLENIYSLMFNLRLNELTKQSDPPFIYAYAGKTSLVRSKDAYMMGAVVKENGIRRGLETVMKEFIRVRKYGFTKGELERAKKIIIRGMERAYNERDKTKSSIFAAEYARNFLTHEPIPGIETEYQLIRNYVPEFTLAEIHNIDRQWITDQNQVIMVNAPEKEGVTVPSKEELKNIFKKTSNMDSSPYEDEVAKVPLMADQPEPGYIVFEAKIDTLGVTEWELSNGIRVVLKPTDFKNDEIRFDAFSPGGHSLAADEEYLSATAASMIMSQSGLGQFNEIQLNKYLAGKTVSASPYIASLYEGISGMASPKDIKTLFQLIYLSFTAPRKDSTAFMAFKKRMKAIFENKQASPTAAFSDTIQVTMAQHHYRARPLSMELLDEMDLDTAFRIYQERFADASDFSFFFVGNFDPDELKPYVKTYLASLPTLNRDENWRDVGIRPPEGIVHKTVKKGIEPKSRVSIIFTGSHDYSRLNNHFLNATVSILRIKLREVLREDLSGTYGVNVHASTKCYPEPGYRATISFGCSPERVTELTRKVFDQIERLQTKGPEAIDLKKVKQLKLKSYQTNIKENGYWLRALKAAYQYGLAPRKILTYPDRIEQIDAEIIQDFARQYFNMDQYVKVVLVPEKEKE